MKTIFKGIFITIFGLWLLGNILPESDTASSNPSVTPIEYPSGVLESGGDNLNSKSPAPSASESKSSSKCESVSTEVTNAIVSGAEAGTGMQAIRASAFRSPDFSKVYFVAMEFSATGIPNQIGVWATNNISVPAAIMSVEGYAKEFTTWPDASTTDAQISGADPSINIAINCLN